MAIGGPAVSRRAGLAVSYSPMSSPPRLELARLPTPIHRLHRLSCEVGREIFVWRDDLTGFAESGNKVRKLEFMLAEALARRATWVVTCGGPQSNHARCTVLAARRLGLGASVVVREPPEGFDQRATWTGNWLLDRIAGAHMILVPYPEYRAAGSTYDPFLEAEAARLGREGERPYLIGEGGSTPLGCLGYRVAVAEMLETWRRSGGGGDGPDALFLALGSGGTHAGVVLGFAACGLDPRRVCAVNVCNDKPYFERRVSGLISETVERYGVERPAGGLRIFDGHVGEGYARATDEDLRFYARMACLEGLWLDPCYTGKAFRGMLAELRRDPAAFGERILFLHSGGGFGTFAYGAQFQRALAGCEVEPA
jgi:D-cysteine desulfhydrase